MAIKSIKTYYPTYHLGCNPIHEVNDWAKVRRLIRAARKGSKIPPIVIDGPMRGGSMVTGTHRAAANDIIMMLGGEPLIDVIDVSDLDNAEQIYDLLANDDYAQINDLLDR